MMNFFGFDRSLTETFAIIGLLIFVYMTVWAIFAIRKKRADLADIAWGLGFLLVAWASQILGQVTIPGFVLNLFITLWAIRLSLHIYFRNRHQQEDFRYQALKKPWDKNVNLMIFLKVFLLQGCILYVIALPILWIHTHSQQFLMRYLAFGFPLWMGGFFLETLADYQLSQFKQDPSKKGTLLTTCVWSYVRHPNYLGELMQGWAIWLMATPLPYGWTLVVSPLLLTFLIVKVSGVKPLEEKMQKHPDYKIYAQKTPSLLSIPFGVIIFFYLISYCLYYAYFSKL